MCDPNEVIREEAAIRRDERERMAKMLFEMFNEAEPGPERCTLAFAITAVRRGRRLTNAEQIENLMAALKDEPSPHPAPKTAI